MSKHEFEKKFENLKGVSKENNSVVVRCRVLSVSLKVVDSLVHINCGDKYFEEVSDIFEKWQLIIDFALVFSFLCAVTQFLADR